MIITIPNPIIPCPSDYYFPNLKEILLIASYFVFVKELEDLIFFYAAETTAANNLSVPKFFHVLLTSIFPRG